MTAPTTTARGRGSPPRSGASRDGARTTSTHPAGDRAGTWARTESLEAARLSPRTSREVFRSVLSAIARPGLIHQLPRLADALPPVLAPLLALADVEVQFALLGRDAESWTELVSTVTGASPERIEMAGWIVALDAPTPDQIASLRTGSSFAPELGARLLVACRTLTAGADQRAAAVADEARVTVEVEGPGVPGSRCFTATGVAGDVVAAIAEHNKGFPAGIDTWLCDGNGDIVAVSRSTGITTRDRRA